VWKTVNTQGMTMDSANTLKAMTTYLNILRKIPVSASSKAQPECVQTAC
ncbi:uncharacterized protein METZ01_LOCUS283582, partial [marine metagenome]